jgi:hypothetical protein
VRWKSQERGSVVLEKTASWRGPREPVVPDVTIDDLAVFGERRNQVLGELIRVSPATHRAVPNVSLALLFLRRHAIVLLNTFASNGVV